MSTLPRRPHVLERRLRFEQRHPEVRIETPIRSANRKWTVFVPGEGTAIYDDPQLMMNALEERYDMVSDAETSHG
jgi:predicted metalloprotease with PDZ domain